MKRRNSPRIPMNFRDGGKSCVYVAVYIELGEFEILHKLPSSNFFTL